MEQPWFSIMFDEEVKLLRVVVAGFWSLDTVRDYIVALDEAIAAVRRRGLPLRIIIDAARMKAQSSVTGETFVSEWQKILCDADDRAAIVAESSLAAMQFRRIYETERCHVVGSTAEAETWLLARG